MVVTDLMYQLELDGRVTVSYLQTISLFCLCDNVGMTFLASRDVYSGDFAYKNDLLKTR